MTTTQHPERRAVEVGDRFMCVAPSDESGSLAVIGRGSDYARVQWDKSGICGIVYDSHLLGGEAFKRIDAPAAAPLAAVCKAPEWCGYRDGDRSDPRRALYLRDQTIASGHLRTDGRRYCSPHCPGAPLAAQPAETEPCVHGHRYHCADCDIARAIVASKPAPQPAPAKGPVFLDCQGCHVRDVSVVARVTRLGRAGLCVSCAHSEEERVCALMAFERSGTPYTGPARLERPKLAHVAGMHDDDLIGGSR